MMKLRRHLHEWIYCSSPGVATVYPSLYIYLY
jgi:hypothetical protein